MAQSKGHTSLERKRVRTGKIVLGGFAFIFVALSLLQCYERQFSAKTPGVFRSLELGSDADDLTKNFDETEIQIDPLYIEQEGISLIEIDKTSSIFWYESSWDVVKSAVLLERSLALNGWELLSSEEESLMCYSYPACDAAEGGFLYATLYGTEQGSSILIEVM